MDAASIQEAAAQFAQTILGQLNSAAASVGGVDVMWFRLQPDHRSKDVIFQSYTLYGVEDCPLSFKAMYSDTGYDDAAITYNIMGINFAIPMTLDIAVETWKTATSNDGTIPQKGDVVFIPMSRKLLEVVSMQPIKSVGAQLTGYKVNLAIYTPTRSRIVGENLRESIENSTTNLEERFGKEIIDNVDDIVDDKQLDIYTSTHKDKYKELSAETTESSSILEIRTIDSSLLIIDGHTVSRSHYDVNQESGMFVRYNAHDNFAKNEWRCLSCWIYSKSTDKDFKNIKGAINIENTNGMTFIKTSVGNKFKNGSNVSLKRGGICIPGIVIDRETIEVNGSLIKSITKNIPNWQNLPGFSINNDNVLNLIESDGVSVRIKGGSYVSVNTSNGERLIPIQTTIEPDRWYGIIVNMGKEFIADVFSSEHGIERVSSVTIQNDLYEKLETEWYGISGTNEKITNIRLYRTRNTDIDKQLTDLVSYNALNDSETVVNDSADVYINKPYMGRQR